MIEIGENLKTILGWLLIIILILNGGGCSVEFYADENTTLPITCIGLGGCNGK